ncbi:hypothetical protein DSECCO2_429470 [anaerobic digester metagenome]
MKNVPGMARFLPTRPCLSGTQRRTVPEPWTSLAHELGAYSTAVMMARKNSGSREAVTRPAKVPSGAVRHFVMLTFRSLKVLLKGLLI